MAPARLKCNTICAVWGKQSSTSTKMFCICIRAYANVHVYVRMYKCATSWSVTVGKVIFKSEFGTNICCQMTVVYSGCSRFFEGFYNVKCLFSVKYTRIVASWCYGCVKCAGPFIWLVVCNVTLANYVFYDVELGCMRRNRRTRNQQVFLNAQNVAWLVFTLPFCALSNFLTCYHILWKRSSYIFVYYYILLNENIYVYYCSCDGCVLRLRDGLAKRKSLM